MEGTVKENLKKVQERAVLVGVSVGKQGADKLDEYLHELAFLCETAGATPVKIFTQNLHQLNAGLFLGSGKVAEITEYIKENDIDLLVFDDELTPSQVRNLEKETGVKILDRNGLILDIFARRAQTAHARTQVELAQYEYLLPRLTGMWTHLQKQKGGIGTKGPGEREIETDRRIIRDKIAQLKRKLKEIDKQKRTQRSNRGDMVRVALVGYTNVGKSTIMNMLSKSSVLAEDKLFATLDTTVRKVVLDNLPFLISDTVGFIRKLPHSLVESFKSTLDEVRESDLIIHIVDISHDEFEEQIDVVNSILSEIGAADKPTIFFLNKIDKYTYVEKDPYDLTPKLKENISLEELKNTWMAKLKHPVVFISATEHINIDKVREVLYKEVKKIHEKRYPFNNFLY